MVQPLRMRSEWTDGQIRAVVVPRGWHMVIGQRCAHSPYDYWPASREPRTWFVMRAVRGRWVPAGSGMTRSAAIESALRKYPTAPIHRPNTATLEDFA